MAIKISDKRLSTVQGQEAIVAAVDLEITMGNSDVKFEGDPSLRALLVERINKYPYSDWLLAIQILTSQHAYEDSRAREAWIEKHLPRVTTPKVVALWSNANSYNASIVFNTLPHELVEKAIPYFTQHTLSQILGDITGSNEVSNKVRNIHNLRLLACFMRSEEPDITEVQNFSARYIERCAKHKTQRWLPAIVHMVNKRYGPILESGSTDDVATVIEHGYQFLKFSRTRNSLTATLYNPHTFKVGDLVTNGRRDNNG